MLKNKISLVTGGTGGLGQQIAKILKAKGSKVFLTGQDQEKLDILSAEYQTIALNLRSSAKIKDVVEEIKPDVLINCAGVFPVGSILQTTEEIFDETFEVNVKAPFLLTKSSIPHMQKCGWGRIVNVGSSSAYGGFANTSVYCASKHALLGLSRASYNELKEHGIRVFCFSPGSIKTEMGKKVQGQDYSTFMEPGEIAKFIVDAISYDHNMISEEVRLNRVFVQ